jgi:hypothetical protein
LGDAGAVEWLASRCDRDADHLDDIGRRWQTRLDAARWTCAKADRYRDMMRGHNADAHRHASDLRQLASDLRRQAQWIRDTTRELTNLENSVRSWFAHHLPKNPGEIPAWWGSGVHPGNLPGPLDPSWQDVAATLRRFGAIL